ncbi:MAG: hypothetical protein ACI4GY_02630 [Acutalibacteraceae bacterium]
MSEIELPLGFGMALAQNEPAMKKFEALSESEKKAFISRTHTVSSKAEMHRLIDELMKS